MAALAAAAILAAAVPAMASQPHLRAADHGCRSRILVLSAMPVELSPLLARERHTQQVRAESRTFYLGVLRGHPVALALTGIGPVNARRTTRAAVRHFRCGGRPSISAILFSGVAGGDFIGDVLVPRRWTQDAGRHNLPVSRALLRVARRIARRPPRLEQRAPLGDPLCSCAPLPPVRPVRVTHRPRVEVGGTGQTTDPFSGHAMPCVPGGGDVFGCDPCPADKHLGAETGRSLPAATTLADPRLFAGYLATSEPRKYVAEDEETAAVDAVARTHHVPFLGVRAVSDGGGDPLHLPGFPAEFFVYRQLAADNAARTTLAVLGTLHH